MSRSPCRGSSLVVLQLHPAVPTTARSRAASWVASASHFSKSSCWIALPDRRVTHRLVALLDPGQGEALWCRDRADDFAVLRRGQGRERGCREMLPAG